MSYLILIDTFRVKSVSSKLTILCFGKSPKYCCSSLVLTVFLIIKFFNIKLKITFGA